MSTRCNIEFYDAPGDGQHIVFGDPAARIYKHSDGYPEGILPMLKKLETRLLFKDPEELKKLPHPYDKDSNALAHARIYGPRANDPEWAAAEFISMFRPTMGGNIYVSQTNHGDIEYLYRVVCHADRLEIKVFEPNGKEIEVSRNGKVKKTRAS